MTNYCTNNAAQTSLGVINVCYTASPGRTTQTPKHASLEMSSGSRATIKPPNQLILLCYVRITTLVIKRCCIDWVRKFNHLKLYIYPSCDSFLFNIVLTYKIFRMNVGCSYTTFKRRVPFKDHHVFHTLRQKVCTKHSLVCFLRLQ